VSREAVASYFFGDYVPAPDAFARGAKKLAPGACLSWKNGATSGPRAWWSPDSATPAHGDHAAPRSRRELARATWRVLEDAVDGYLVADVPVGVLLSGGIDSSAIAAIAARRTPYRLKSFTLGFSDPTFDERPHARAVAAHVGTEHYEDVLSERDLEDLAARVLARLDEPLADPSLLPTWAVARLAAREVKVVLGGDGADELWAGYPTLQAHRVAAAYALLPDAARRAAERLVARLRPGAGYQPLEWKLRRFVLRWDDSPTLRHLRWMSSADLPDLAALTRGGPLPRLVGERPPATGDIARDALALDFATYLP
jgi:asparagine synthase (glutamine-hydrolysing)